MIFRIINNYNAFHNVLTCNEIQKKIKKFIIALIKNEDYNNNKIETNLE